MARSCRKNQNQSTSIPTKNHDLPPGGRGSRRAVLFVQTSLISALLDFIGTATIGFCLFGPDTIISGAAAQDVGGKRNVAKSAGFIDGLGSIRATLQGVVTATISQVLSWNYLFSAFVRMSILACLALMIGHRPKRSIAELRRAH